VNNLLIYEEPRNVTTIVGQWNYRVCQCRRHDSSIVQVGLKSFENYLGLGHDICGQTSKDAAVANANASVEKWRGNE
jgi:hypothetical protein